jgi:hypothetical protein
MNRLVTCGLLVFCLSGCTSSTAPVMPPPTAPTLAGPPPTPDATAGPMLSGIVFESSTDGSKQPLSGSRVYYAFADGTRDFAVTDEAGRYSVGPVPDGSRVRLTAFAVVKAGWLFQRSGASTTLRGDTALDVELVPSGVRGGAYTSPTLSGVVYRATPAGQQPVAQTRVFYRSLGVDAPFYDVYLETDEQGRFDFGRLPLGPGRLGAGNCNDQAEFVTVEINGDMVADVDLTTLFSTCPGVPY